MKSIVKMIKNIHRKPNNISNNRYRGEKFDVSLAGGCDGVSVITAGTGVTVAVEVLVGAGNISVMAGKGASVLVSVTIGVVLVVDASVGVLGDPVGDGEP